MKTMVFLIVVWQTDIYNPQISGGMFQGYVQSDRQLAIPAPTIKIQEMPNLHMCESIGEWIVRLNSNAKYNCIEGAAE